MLSLTRLAPATRPVVSSFRSIAPTVRPQLAQRGALQVVAAEAGKKAVKKKLPSPEKQALKSQERRMYNRKRKSTCATFIKKVIQLAETLKATPVSNEDEVKPLEVLISKAFCELDKAVVKGILHQNTAARKKARCSRYKKAVLIAAGLYTPPAPIPAQ